MRKQSAIVVLSLALLPLLLAFCLLDLSCQHSGALSPCCLLLSTGCSALLKSLLEGGLLLLGGQLDYRLNSFGLLGCRLGLTLGCRLLFLLLFALTITRCLDF